MILELGVSVFHYVAFAKSCIQFANLLAVAYAGPMLHSRHTHEGVTLTARSPAMIETG